MENNLKRNPNDSFSKSLAISKSEDGATYKFIGSYEDVDRDGDIVYVDGIDTKNFDNNPIVLFNHDTNQPIGKAVNHSIELVGGKKAMVFEVEFSSISEAQKIKTLVDEGILNTTSIRFLATKYQIIESNDRWGYDITESELLELSIAPIPANAQALIQKTLDLIKLEDPEPSQEETSEGISEDEPIEDAQDKPADEEKTESDPVEMISDDEVCKALCKSLDIVNEDEIINALVSAFEN